MKNKYLLSFAVLASLSASAASGDEGNLYVWSGGSVVYTTAMTNVEDVVVSDDKSTVSVKDINGNSLYTTSRASLDSIGFYPVTLKADLLDVVFNADGSATDVSPQHLSITNPSTTNLNVYWNSTYSRYVAHSSAAWKDAASGHYRVPLNDSYFSKLQDGYTLEAIVMTPEKGGTMTDDEVKWIGCHQNGGPGGILVSKRGSGSKLSFLPHTSTTGYCWASVDYEVNRYYHVIGVYSKEEQKAKLYVDGNLVATVDAVGDLTKPSDSSSQWWAIFGDPQSGAQEQTIPGDVVMFRLYDKVVNDVEAKLLWDNVPHRRSDLPVADLLDVAFKADGTAFDLSVARQTVETNAHNELSTYFSGFCNRTVAHGTSAWGANNNRAYYKVDAAGYFSKLKDGYTLEAVVMSPQLVTTADAKWIACHQNGGPGGIMISKSKNSRITFLPHTGDYRYAIDPNPFQTNRYYHVVGVYDQSTAKALLYIDGALASSVDATGTLTLPSVTSSQWWAIFGDPQSGKQNQTIPGDIAMFRLYDNVLTSSQISLLYNDWKNNANGDYANMVSNVTFLTNVPVKKEGGRLEIFGDGFAEGDRVEMIASQDHNSIYYPTCSLDNGTLMLTMPDNLVDGSYLLVLSRDGVKQELGTVNLSLKASLHTTNVIAHRGYWNTPGASQNSRASLQKAIDLGIYGSECDVWLTTDGVLMVNHDPSFSGTTIQTSTSSTCKALTLGNGESMPTLEDLLKILKASAGNTKLIIEIKSHSSTTNTKKAAKAAVDLVKQYGLQDRVEYIAFSWDACTYIMTLDATAKVAYLNGDKTPQEVKDAGLTGIDYEIAKMTANSGWFDAAHNLGLGVNVWTLRNYNDIIDMINCGADYLTTDMPVDAIRYKRHYDINQ